LSLSCIAASARRWRQPTPQIRHCSGEQSAALLAWSFEQAGALALFFGNAGGLYVVGVGMMASFVFMVTGAWLLIIGVRREEAAQATA
jgi:hypothetical protein